LKGKKGRIFFSGTNLVLVFITLMMDFFACFGPYFGLHNPNEEFFSMFSSLLSAFIPDISPSQKPNFLKQLGYKR